MLYEKKRPLAKRKHLYIVALFVCIGGSALSLVSPNRKSSIARAISLFYYLAGHSRGRNALLYEGTGINLASGGRGRECSRGSDGRARAHITKSQPPRLSEIFWSSERVFVCLFALICGRRAIRKMPINFYKANWREMKIPFTVCKFCWKEIELKVF